MIVDLQDLLAEHEMIRDADSEAYARNACWPLADFECRHGHMPEDCDQCRG